MYKAITHCRACGSEKLRDIVDLGQQALTGVFPKSRAQKVDTAPLQLVKCEGECHLVQLKHTYDLGEMYGDNYGYRSGLNQSMVRHLHAKVDAIRKIVALKPGDVVIDIGSNDATTLKAYPSGLRRIGVDPTGTKFREFYTDGVELVADFFSADKVRAHAGNISARVITSFSMFYDLEEPVKFAAEIAGLLADDGIWVLEQSYMPEMLAQNSFDTICHEHLEYYGLRQIKWIAEKAGLKIIDVDFNDVNGGSFSIVVAKANSPIAANTQKIDAILAGEQKQGLDTPAPYAEFDKRIHGIRERLRAKIRAIHDEGKTVYALGASTKGNVTLQYCGLDETFLPLVGEVNPDKFGAFTPGTLIPIVSEAELLAKKPDYLLVLPWHFRAFFEKNPALKGVTLLFPLDV